MSVLLHGVLDNRCYYPGLHDSWYIDIQLMSATEDNTRGPFQLVRRVHITRGGVVVLETILCRTGPEARERCVKD